MRALDLPPVASLKRARSPVPLTLGALVVVLAVRLAGIVPEGPAPTLSAGIALAEVAPAAAPAAAPGPNGAVSPSAPPAPAETPAERTTRLIDDILAPSAGATGTDGPRADTTLQPEPFLAERRALARQQEALQVRRMAMEVAEKRLRGYLDELAALRDEVRARLGELEAQDEARITRLVTLYEKMNPKKAAVIFDDLDFAVLAPLALAMSERKLAPVVAAMQPQVARRLTAELARRRHDAGLEAALSLPALD